ncbi:cell division protein ZapA [Sinanaerobacter sp. ZZT-01]|uniref:cell division protein ZapA n=1 Tax=Sinanaerobacter sp. ZZT-01 TaxID=3111540 RepID=UPI002D79DD82|nr:cell division protein ZapA [Sinanaerobacter sp. ZZT-01]WRR93697.1 cell division protein ZapA [Sinanaerobacter sp. ZZT-01]
MEDKNKVTVRIYGQEYIISGDMPREHIMKVADYVDRKMNEIAAVLSATSTSSLAVLSAVNVADDYFRGLEENQALKQKNIQLDKDTKHYAQLWDEAKKNFLQYKEDAQSIMEHRDQLQRLFNEKTVEVNQLSSKLKTIKEQYDALVRKSEALQARMKSQEENKISNSSIVKELEAKCRDVESSFFDLQMENIQLKGELDRYKKMME